ncbi:MAG: hypothetical protein ACTS8S_02580 [Giesbergeria sp.]
MLIWWLTPAELSLLIVERGGISYPNMPRSIPQWLIEQVLACNGRPGRGRLWIHGRLMPYPIELEEIANWTTPLRIHTDSCYGIVITPIELPHLRDLPGIVTNFHYQRLPQAAD